MNTNSLGTKKEKTEWYWQPTDLDGDSDDNMQIPERRESTGMIYLPSYVDVLSVTDTAYSDLYKKNTEQTQEQQPKMKVDMKSADMNKPTSPTLFVEMNETPKKEEKSKAKSEIKLNKRKMPVIPHGRRVLIFGGTMATQSKGNDVFTLEIGKHRPLPPGPPDAKTNAQMTAEEIGCRNNCTGHGICPSGKCHCTTGWEGVDCSVRAPLPLPPPEPKLHLPTDYVIVSPSGVGCPDKCHGRGECRGGECMCDAHW